MSHVLGAVDVAGDFGTIENTQELIHAVEEPGERAIESDEVGFAHRGASSAVR